MSRFETSENLRSYFKSIDQLSKPLDKSQEHQLAALIQEGDESALNSLVQANLKFVVTLANKFIGMGLSVEDLIQEGNLGLIDAAKKFTPDRDTKFITYAQFWIRKRMNTAIVEKGKLVKLPMNQEYDIYKKKMAGEETIGERTIAIDKQVSEDDDTTLGDLILREDFSDPFEQAEMDKLLLRLLNTLKPSEREIVELFYGLVGDGLSTKEIAERVDKTPAEVNRALKMARARMRKEVSA